MDEEELIRLGFRWTHATPIVLNDGRHATVTPSVYSPSKDKPDSSEHARKAARLYSLACDDGRSLSERRDRDGS